MDAKNAGDNNKMEAASARIKMVSDDIVRGGDFSRETKAKIEKLKRQLVKENEITVQGRKGMKNTPFSKTFPNQAALDKWLAQNDGDVEIDRYSR